MTPEPTRILPSDREAVAEAMARIDGSATFAASRQARQLLRYLTEAALAGAGERLKGYTLGVEVLGRPADFDPSTDTSVRVAMRRLRKLLADYYAQEGAGDPVRLQLVPGEYAPTLIRSIAAPAPAAPLPVARPETPRRARVPLAAALVLLGLLLGAFALQPGLPRPAAESAAVVFEGESGARVRQSQPALPATTPRDAPPVLRVTPVTAASAMDAAAAEALTRDLRSGLARFTELVVLDSTSGEARETARLGGVLKSGGRFALELRDAASGLVLGAFDGELGREAGGEAVRFIVTAIAQPHGLLLSALARDLPSEPVPGFSCLLRLFALWRGEEAGGIEAVAACLNQAPATGAAAGPILAARALAALELSRVAEARQAALLEEAEKRAQRAVQVAPHDPRAQQALAAVLRARGDLEAAIAALRSARRANPWDPDIAADLAVLLLAAGEVEEARALLREACAFLALRPAGADFHLFLAELLAGNAAAAVERAARLSEDGPALHEVARAIAARFAGDEAAAERSRARLAARDPAWASEPDRLLRPLLPSPELASDIAEALAGPARLAGLAEPAGRPGPGGCLGDRSR